MGLSDLPSPDWPDIEPIFYKNRYGFIYWDN
jgi:hypothetical protein